MNLLLILFGKFISKISTLLNLGHGSTWPGHIAFLINKNFINDILENSRVITIVISGTNGKTTTAKLIQQILEKNNKTVLINQSGANLLNGIASSVILESNFFGKLNKQFAVFETDENALPQIVEMIKPNYLIALDLFRDQLDRYGEIDTIVSNWKKAYEKIKKKTVFILNADDPQVASLGINLKGNILYFGLEDKSVQTRVYQNAADSIFCPNCSSKLNFASIYFSHLGDWQCENCKLKRPKLSISTYKNYPLLGIYNRYNALAAVLLAKQVGLSDTNIEKALQTFKPAFGRQETIEYNGKKIKIFLTKNPTSFNETLKTLNKEKAKNILFVLNDRIPDGRDVSWIWDTDVETTLHSIENITITGDRYLDMALRIKYADIQKKAETYENLKEAIDVATKKLKEKEILYILPTYSAMLETRKILTGKKIL